MWPTSCCHCSSGNCMHIGRPACLSVRPSVSLTWVATHLAKKSTCHCHLLTLSCKMIPLTKTANSTLPFQLRLFLDVDVQLNTKQELNCLNLSGYVIYLFCFLLHSTIIYILQRYMNGKLGRTSRRHG